MEQVACILYNIFIDNKETVKRILTDTEYKGKIVFWEGSEDEEAADG